ncbi:MAG: hypothetical protein ACAI34_19505 [Verrucomicrobium sp.]|nr:hypothetical protein [Verrucomicrobium sp.]
MSGVIPAMGLAATEPEAEDLYSRWYATVSRLNEAVIKSEEGDLRLEVSLIREEETTFETVIQGDSEFQHFSFGQRKLPMHLRPEDGMLKTFRFFWKGKEIKVPERLWNDVGGFRLERSSFATAKLAPVEKIQVEEWDADLLLPKVVLSADGGTAMVEWPIIDTGACCGHRATLRWLFSQSGHLMRHRHTTPNLC